jgi:ribosomal-protein-alanine N-acetyltransferase
VACDREGAKEDAKVKQYIFGFAGFWMMAGEAHIVNFAVRQSYRRQGIGELLLISLIDLAMEMNSNIVTLEVRASNTVAQELYRKYGFIVKGLRRGYYSDDREDAVIMTLEDVDSVSFQEQLNQLKQAHSRKWGIILHKIA